MPKTRGDHTSKALKQKWAESVRFGVEKKKISKVKLAKKIGVSKQVLTDWENLQKKGLPSLENALAFAREVDEPLSWLLGDRFHGKKNAANLSDQLATQFGYERLAALLEIPEHELIDEIDRIIGRALVRSRSRKKPSS